MQSMSQDKYDARVLNFEEENLQEDSLQRLTALMVKAARSKPIEGVMKELFDNALELADLLLQRTAKAKNFEELEGRIKHPAVRWFLVGPSDLERAEFLAWLGSQGMTTRMGQDLTGLGERSYRDLRAVAKLSIECKTILATNRNIKESHIRKLRPPCPGISLETRMRYVAQHEPNCNIIVQWMKILLDRADDPEGALKKLLKKTAPSSRRGHRLQGKHSF